MFRHKNSKIIISAVGCALRWSQIEWRLHDVILKSIDFIFKSWFLRRNAIRPIARPCQLYFGVTPLFVRLWHVTEERCAWNSIPSHESRNNALYIHWVHLIRLAKCFVFQLWRRAYRVSNKAHGSRCIGASFMLACNERCKISILSACTYICRLATWHPRSIHAVLTCDWLFRRCHRFTDDRLLRARVYCDVGRRSMIVECYVVYIKAIVIVLCIVKCYVVYTGYCYYFV